jgi:uncharacterized protein (DUF924 family)
MSQAKPILEFWFGHPDKSGYGKPKAVWFSKKPEFDQELVSRFHQDYHKAAAGHLDDWLDLPETCLALILLLDQFPRNMFRGTPQAFATDWEALSAAHHAVAQGYDRELLPVQRWFIYLPFEHSENLEHQRRGIKLFQQLSHDPFVICHLSLVIGHWSLVIHVGINICRCGAFGACRERNACNDIL